jgi:hypothetical protein
MTDEQEQTKPVAVSMRFQVTIDGNTIDKGTLKAEAWKLDADGNILDTAPLRERDGENVLVSLFDAGAFLQSVSLSMARKIALDNGEIVAAVQITKLADSLELNLTPLDPADVTASVTKFAGEHKIGVQPVGGATA